MKMIVLMRLAVLDFEDTGADEFYQQPRQLPVGLSRQEVGLREVSSHFEFCDRLYRNCP